MQHSTDISHFPAPTLTFNDPDPRCTRRTFVAKSGATAYPHRPPSHYSESLFAPSNTASRGVLCPPSPPLSCCSSFSLSSRHTHTSQTSNRNERAKTEVHSIRPIRDTERKVQVIHSKLTKKRTLHKRRSVAGLPFASSSQAHSHVRQSSTIPLLSTFPLDTTDTDSLLDQSEYEHENKRQMDRVRACRRKKIDKLSRTFGESAPQHLIFPELAPVNFDRHIDQNIPSSRISSFVMTPDATGGSTPRSRFQSDAIHAWLPSREHTLASPTGTSAVDNSSLGAHTTRGRTPVPPNFSSDECPYIVDFDVILDTRPSHSKIDSTIPPLPSTPPSKESLRRHRRRSQASTLAPMHENRRMSSNLSIAEETKLSKHHEIEVEKTNYAETASEIFDISRQGKNEDLRTSIELLQAPLINLSSSSVHHNSNVKQHSSVSRATKVRHRKASIRPNSLTSPILVDGNGQTYLRFDYFMAGLIPAASPDSMSFATHEAKYQSRDLSSLPPSGGELSHMEAPTVTARNEGKEARDITATTDGVRAPSRVSSPFLLSVNIGSQVEHGRRKENEWSGEWNLEDIGEVVKALRGLKAE